MSKPNKITIGFGVLLVLFALWWIYSTFTLGGDFTGYLLLLALLVLYFFPTYTAWRKKKTNLEAIMILNLFFGWTLLGWVVALIWAVRLDDKSSPESGVDKLHKLAELKEAGHLTQEEFNTKKEQLLKS